MRLFAALLLALSFSAQAFAHVMPNSVVNVRLQPETVSVEARVPVSELELAFGAPLAADDLNLEDEELVAYLLDHVAISDPDGGRWTGEVESLAPAQEEDHLLLDATLTFSPPDDQSALMNLEYDVVNHEVMSHFALVYLAVGGDEPLPLGRLQNPESAIFIGPELFLPEGVKLETIKEEQAPPQSGLVQIGVVAGLVLFAMAVVIVIGARRRRPKSG